jgi:eukaryotic-like serine/threonine-protein kinase
MRAPNRHSPRLRGLRLHDRFALGATGSVCFGWLAPRELVCVKRMHPFHVVPEDAVRVEHPNVVETIGIVRRPGELLAAMEYVPGASLQEIFEARPDGLEPPLAAGIVAGVLHGLHAAHETRRTVLPRGLSPSSIVVGDDGNARLLDLDVYGPSTAAAAIDKLPYAAPEQVARGDARVDVRRDIWAAGVVLWEALTGRSLFRATTVEGTLHAIRVHDVPPPSHVVWTEIDPALDAIVTRALARDPNARFASAREMAIALERTSCAMPEDLACALAEMDMRSISLRKVLADTVTRRERSGLHIECSQGVSKE